MSNNDAFWYDGNRPCNGCPSEGVCALEKLACEDFLHYAGTGSKRFQSRDAGPDLYDKLFPTESGCK